MKIALLEIKIILNKQLVYVMEFPEMKYKKYLVKYQLLHKIIIQKSCQLKNKIK